MVGLSKLHAVAYGLQLVGVVAVCMVPGYMALLSPDRLRFGLPELPAHLPGGRAARGRRDPHRRGRDVVRAAGAGDALLPRFVVFGAAIVLVPCLVLCAAIRATAARGPACAIE